MCKFYFNCLQNEKTGPRIVKPIRGGGGGAGNVASSLSHKKPAVSTTHSTAAAGQSKSVTKPAGTRADVICASKSDKKFFMLIGHVESICQCVIFEFQWTGVYSVNHTIVLFLTGYFLYQQF